MKQRTSKSILAMLLVIAMLVTIVPVGNLVHAATEPEEVTFEFKKFASNYIRYEGQTSSGEALKSSFYKVMATIERDNETITKEIVLTTSNATAEPKKVLIEPDFYHYPPSSAASTPPTKSFALAKDAVLTEVQCVNNAWSVVEGGKSYKLSKGVKAVNNNGTWTQEVELSSLGSVVFRLGAKSSATDVYFQEKLSDGTKMEVGLYKVLATLEFTDKSPITKYIVIQIESSQSGAIWQAFWDEYPATNTTTVPTKSFTIAKDAVLTEVTSGTYKPVEGGHSYKMGETFGAEMDTSGQWKEKLTGANFEFKQVRNDKAFTFKGMLADNSALPSGFYQVFATVDNSQTKITMEVTDGGDIVIHNNFFSQKPADSVTGPTQSLVIAKDAVLQEVAVNTWEDVYAGNRYRISKEIRVEKQEGEWCVPLAYLDSISMRLNAVGSDSFVFYGKISDESKLKAGFYRVVATIDDTTTKEITIQTYQNGKMEVWNNFFNWKPGSGNKPTTSLKIAKDAVFKEVQCSTAGVWSDVDGSKRYKLEEDFCIQTDAKNTWYEVRPEVTFEFSNATKDGFTFKGTLGDGSKLPVGFYKVNATIGLDDGDVTKEISLEVRENDIIIWPNFFQWPITETTVTFPTKSLTFAKGTTITEIKKNTWDVEQVGNKYLLGEELSVIKKGDVWLDAKDAYDAGDVNGDGTVDVKDLVRYIKYVNNADVTVTVGADVNGNNNDKDDLDSLRQLLVGVNVPTKTYFSLVKNGTSNYRIVKPANATTNETTAANELQQFLKEATGAELPIVSESGQTAATGKYIYIGGTQAANTAGICPRRDDVQDNGFVIKTIDDDCYLLGYSDIGTRNSVYEFLDYAFDYEFYAADEIHLRKTANAWLLKFDLMVTPDFEWRLPPNGSVIFAENGDFANATTGLTSHRMRFNIAEEVFVMRYDFHNSYLILPPSTYWEAHPDWYSRKSDGTAITDTPNGVRIPSQLCYSNEEMCEEFITQLLKKLKTTKVANIMIGQEDMKDWCQCAACTASKNTYGTDSAVVIKFANKVQKAVDDWFAVNRPNEEPTRLVIFAYQKTAEPPVVWNATTNQWIPKDESVILNDHSGVMFSTISMQMQVPFVETDSKSLSTPYGRLLGWNACNDHIFAWTYSLYMYQGLLFSNTIDVMEQNYRLLLEHGVTMLYDQADGYQKKWNSGFSVLETYLMSKMQWDASLDMSQLIDDFFDHYYGSASATMKRLFDLERKNILNKYQDTSLGFQGTIGEDVLTKEFWPKREVDAYKELIQQAYSDIASLKTTDAERYRKLYNHILLESMQFDYIDGSLYNTDTENRNIFKNNFEALGLTSYTQDKKIDELWKAWGIKYSQVMSYCSLTPTDNGDSFLFTWHKKAASGWYKGQAYVDGVLTPVMVEVMGEGTLSSSCYIYWHCFNDNISSATTIQPKSRLEFVSGTIFVPVVMNQWSKQDLTRPSYCLETGLSMTKAGDAWAVADAVSKAPANGTATFDYAPDNNSNGKYDFRFNMSATHGTGWYRGEATIDGKEGVPVLIQIEAGGKGFWIYEACFNDNGVSTDSLDPTSSLKLTKGSVLTPIIWDTKRIDTSRQAYKLSTDVEVTKTSGTWKSK